MAFPETRLTLIHRIAKGDDDAAWQRFLADYWRPICLFAKRIGNLSWEDAEDVASQTIDVLNRKELIGRWLATPQARFKTLLCSVIRNLVSNTVRSAHARARRTAEYAADWDAMTTQEVNQDDINTFYAIWADELIRGVVEALMWQYHRDGRGDYFRVLYGRICDQLTSKDLAEQLGIKLTDAENYYRHAKQQLTAQIETALRREIEQYGLNSDLEEEFRLEWGQLAAYFEQRGGLEETIRLVAASGEMPNS